MSAFSPSADSIRFEAVRMVDELEHRRGYPMSIEEQGEALRANMGYLCHTRCLEELAPINRQLAKLAALTIGPFSVPPEIEAFRQSIIGRWQRIAAELLGGPTKE